MMLSIEAARRRAMEYANNAGVEVTDVLGFGLDGVVFRTRNGTALKVIGRTDRFQTERAVYTRLREGGVTNIRGHSVPALLNTDCRLLIIEMSIVQPPYLLDFAKATLDNPPNFPHDAVEMWREAKYEVFGDRWPAVEDVMATMVLRHGVYLTDINPGNITFGDDDPPIQ